MKALANHTHHGSSHHTKSKAGVLPGKNVYIELLKNPLWVSL